MKITSVLLAGGLNKRMNGIPKWELRMNQEIMLERSIRKLKSISAKILIITGGDYKFTIEDNDLPIQIIYDRTPYLGPLNGIATALKHTTDKYHFVVAADMPFFSTKLTEYMYEDIINNQFEMVIPKWKGQLQPLHSIYSVNVLDSMLADIDQGKFSLIKWINKQLKVGIIDESAVKEFNRKERIFFNMNCLEDYQKALSWETEEGENE